MVEIKNCPIETTLQFIGKKWSFEIVRDMFLGKKRFNEFLETNPNLSSKVLSQRLKELKKTGIIVKKVDDTFPVSIEYNLTEKGKKLNRVIYELALFSLNTCPEYDEEYAKKSIKFLKENLNIED